MTVVDPLLNNNPKPIPGASLKLRLPVGGKYRSSITSVRIVYLFYGAVMELII